MKEFLAWTEIGDFEGYLAFCHICRVPFGRYPKLAEDKDGYEAHVHCAKNQKAMMDETGVSRS